MFELKGKYNSCKVFTDNCDNETISQLTNLLNQEYVSNSQIRIMPDTHAGAGCVIGTTMTLHNKVCCNLVGVDIGCLDKDSEILTPNGWIKISNYNGEEILIYDKASGKAFFEVPYLYLKDKCDEFYYFHTTKGLNQMLSKEHKMLIFEGYKNRGYIQKTYLAEEFYEKIINRKKADYYSVKTTFDWDCNGIDISDDILRLLIMESADGHLEIRTNGDCYTELHFRKERKILRAKELLNKCNISYKETIGTDGTTYIYFKDNRINTKDLRSLYGASKHQLEIVADEVFYWDGTIDKKRNHKNYCTTVKTNADVIQWVFACLGIRAGIYAVNDKKHPHYSTHYLVYPTKNEYVSFGENKPEKIKSEDGYKYCFTTSTGFFVMRRNNCISITGNCGMLTIKLKEKRVNLPELDSVIKKYVPSGGEIHEEAIAYSNIENLACAKYVNIERAYKSLGSLGGGNHFLEIDKSESGDLYLVIHTGSRHLGLEVCNYYQEAGYKALQDKATGGSYQDFADALIKKLKAEGKQKEISKELAKLKTEFKSKSPSIPYELAYVEGENFKNYIHDMKIMQEHAEINRATIAKIILKKAKLHEVERFETVHNYIDTENMILRKGSVSAQKGEKILIPMNMRDGSLICIGKGNPDWNFSAPHGAGRLMSRSKAKESISMNDFKKSMEGIYTSCVNASTIDESPMAYKPMDEIVENIQDTAEIVDIVKPIYNFKASEM